MDGASTKDSCSAATNKNETSVPQLDTVKILTCLIMDLKDLIPIQLDHDPNI